MSETQTAATRTDDGRTVITCYLHAETTGPWFLDRNHDWPGQPHVCRLALLLHDGGTGQVRRRVWVVRVPPDIEWDWGTQRRTGLSQSICDRGTDPAEVFGTVGKVMHALVGSRNVAPRVRAYGAHWHRSVIEGSARRSRYVEAAESIADAMRGVTCIMSDATGILMLPGRYGRGYRFPTLAIAYEHFAGTPLDLPDDAIARGQTIIDAVRTVDTGITNHLVAGSAR